MIARFILNIYASALLSFVCSIGIVFLFSPLKNPRFRACLFLIPFLKVIWDLFFAAHANWVYLQNLSVWHVPENSRTLGVYAHINGLPGCGIYFSLFDSYRFSLGDILHEIWPNLSLLLAFSLLSISILKLIYHLFLFKHRYDKTLPCAVTGFWKPKIRFSPSYLRSLNQDEKGAVLKHEKSHIRWGDHMTEHFLFFFEALFWFLPLKKKLREKLHLSQEMACDRAAQSPIAIAGALKKALMTTRAPLILPFASPAHERVTALLQSPPVCNSYWRKGLYILTFGLVLIFILMSQFLPF